MAVTGIEGAPSTGPENPGTGPEPAGPPKHPGRRARVGIDSFSFHRWFGETNQWEKPLAERWTTLDLLDHVLPLGLEALSVQTVHLDDTSASSLSRISGQLTAMGAECILAWGHRSGLEDGRSKDKLKDALATMDVALALGCRVMRVVCGDQYSWTKDPAARHERLTNLRGPLTTIAKQAEQVDLVVAVENHADASATEIAHLVASVDSTHLGTCFDAGNAARVGDDLLQAVAATRPYCVMAHLRDLKLQEASRGDPTGWWPCVALGQGDLCIPSVLEALAGAARCRAWLVETSNLLPGGFEPEIVQTSLAYLRHWFASLDATTVG